MNAVRTNRIAFVVVHVPINLRLAETTNPLRPMFDGVLIHQKWELGPLAKSEPPRVNKED